jgi:hypothetical protein
MWPAAVFDPTLPPRSTMAKGWADIHCHPMAQAGLGNTLAGHVHSPRRGPGLVSAGARARARGSHAPVRPGRLRPAERRVAGHDRLDGRHARGGRRAWLPRLAGF